MTKKMTEAELMALLKRKLEEQGIGFENLLEIIANVDDEDVQVVCATADDLSVSIAELSDTNRDQVVMVRVDGDTAERLAMWVETGAVKSKSEAAALFVKEGLKLRAKELGELTDAIDDVKKAREKLQSRAQRILGKGDE